MKQLTVSELIDALWALDGREHEPVYVWVNGIRLPVMYVDDTLTECVDIAVEGE